MDDKSVPSLEQVNAVGGDPQPQDLKASAALREIEEYKSLRAEIAQRSEFQQRFINYSLVVTAAFFAFPGKADLPWIYWLQPFILWAFAVNWRENDYTVQKIAAYLRFVDSDRPHAWESVLLHGLPFERDRSSGSPSDVDHEAVRRGEKHRFLRAIRAIFILCQATCILLGLHLVEMPPSAFGLLMLLGAIVATVQTWRACDRIGPNLTSAGWPR